jgi:hypothetical protein
MNALAMLRVRATSLLPTANSSSGLRGILVRLLFVGFLLHVLSHFSPLSNKAVNNFYYLLVLVPALLTVDLRAVRFYLAQPVIQSMLLFLVYTGTYMTVTDDPGELRNILYVVSLLIAIHTLVHERLLNTKLFAYFLFGVVIIYVTLQLGWWVIGEGRGLPARPFFYGWQLFVPTFITAYLSVASMAAAGILIEQGRLKSAFLLTVPLVVVSTLLISRMGLAGLVTAAPFMVWLAIVSETNLQKKDLFGLSALVGIAGLAAHHFGMFDILMQRGSSYRLDLLNEVFTEVGNCGWLLGCGFDHTYTLQIKNYLHVTEHSIYAHQLLATGLIGLALMLGFILLVIRTGIRAKSPWLLAFVAGCGTLLVEGQSLLAQPRTITQFLFWIPCFVVLVTALNDGFEETASAEPDKPA